MVQKGTLKIGKDMEKILMHVTENSLEKSAYCFQLYDLQEKAKLWNQ